MTSFEIRRVPFDSAYVRALEVEPRATNWPVVYTLNNAERIYVGQTTSAVSRMLQHLDSEKRELGLELIRIIFDERFNVSAALDLESHLIRWFDADQQFASINANAGVVDRNYYLRDDYRRTFREIFDALREDGLFRGTRAQIENSELFKFSPYKSLNEGQAAAVESILEGLFDDLAAEEKGSIVVQGEPGTGKSVVAVTLLKMLADIRDGRRPDDHVNAPFHEFYGDEYRTLLTERDFRIGFVAPQPGLRRTLEKVFAKTPGLAKRMALSAAEVGNSQRRWDLLVVDEAHRLAQPGAQGSGFTTATFQRVQERLFGDKDAEQTQLDWILARSDHQILLVDPDQAVRPRDVPVEHLREVIRGARSGNRHYTLASQMRVSAGDDYIAFLKELLAGRVERRRTFDGYDLRLFDDAGAMQDAIRARDAEVGLARVLAGFAWPWASKGTPDGTDFRLDGRDFRWNDARASEEGWATSANAVNEVGSIHTIQGFDLTYAGVIIGPDLRYDPVRRRTVFHPESYADSAGNERNRHGGRRTFTDEDIERFVRNIYAVLMTRGILGTYVYACDPALREYLRKLIPAA